MPSTRALLSPVWLPLFRWRPGLILLVVGICLLRCYGTQLSARYRNDLSRCLWHLYLR